MKRYCALTRKMDAAGTEFFWKLEQDESADEEDYAAAERQFVERYAPEFQEIARVAPPEIRADLRTLLAGQRQRAGLESAAAPSEAEVTAAEERVQSYEKRNCT